MCPSSLATVDNCTNIRECEVYLAPLLYNVRSSHTANTNNAIQAVATWPFCLLDIYLVVVWILFGWGVVFTQPVYCKIQLTFGKLSSFFLEVFICGGYNGEVILGDLWKLNLLTFQWTKLLAIMPEPAYFHCAAVTPVCQFLFFTDYLMCHITICSKSHFVVTCIFMSLFVFIF